MKKNANSKKHNAKPAPKSPPPEISVPAPTIAPLAGEALELKVAETMCEGFRASDARKALREACNGAEHSAIEAAIVSPRVKAIVEPVSRAFALEESVAVIRLLLSNARAALTAEKPTPAQILALKIVFETIVEKMMSGIGGGLWQDGFNFLGLSELEKSVVEDSLQLMRRLSDRGASDSENREILASATREPVAQLAAEGA